MIVVNEELVEVEVKYKGKVGKKILNATLNQKVDKYFGTNKKGNVDKYFWPEGVLINRLS